MPLFSSLLFTARRPIFTAGCDLNVLFGRGTSFVARLNAVRGRSSRFKASLDTLKKAMVLPFSSNAYVTDINSRQRSYESLKKNSFRSLSPQSKRVSRRSSVPSRTICIGACVVYQSYTLKYCEHAIALLLRYIAIFVGAKLFLKCDRSHTFQYGCFSNGSCHVVFSTMARSIPGAPVNIRVGCCYYVLSQTFHCCVKAVDNYSAYCRLCNFCIQRLQCPPNRFNLFPHCKPTVSSFAARLTIASRALVRLFLCTVHYNHGGPCEAPSRGAGSYSPVLRTSHGSATITGFAACGDGWLNAITIGGRHGQ
jgi:hypothetical protein